MNDVFFKGYWLLTNRCNLDCGYCVLEDTPKQLRQELSLDEKMDLVGHLYEKLGFRRLTLSGGEVLLMGKQPPRDFIELLRFLRNFRSPYLRQNLEIEVYTNGSLLDDRVANEMAGVVDLVALTVDSQHDETLTRIGRNTARNNAYYKTFLDVCGRLSERGIAVKLHSVIGRENVRTIGGEVESILNAVEARGARVATWKFYQYMSYDDPRRDNAHAISKLAYEETTGKISSVLSGRDVPLHFKDTAEMKSSLFNILSYGNAQYMLPGDTWTTSRRTGHLRQYVSMAELLSAHQIDEGSFRRYHEIKR